MRWDRLFDDLEGQLEHELEAEEIDVAAEEERLRLARLTLRDRLVPMAGLGRPDREPVRIAVRDGSTVRLRASAVGRDWIAGELIGDSGVRLAAVVPFAAVVALLPSPEQRAFGVTGAEPAAGPAASLSARLGLGFVLRDLSRRRVPVRVTIAASHVHGTIDRVARDHFDLAEHEPEEVRRAGATSRIRIVPHASLDLVRY